jgi:hypothetical protein
MLKEIGVFTFLLAFLLIVVAFYIGFSWDVMAFGAASTRVARELITGAGGKAMTGNTSAPTTQGSGLVTTNV